MEDAELILPPAEPTEPVSQGKQPDKPTRTENLTMQEMFRLVMEKMDENHKSIMEELRKDRNKDTKNDSKLETEEIPDDKNMEQLSKEIKNKEKTSELSSEIKLDKTQENIKRRDMKSNKMRRMYPRNLIKTKEESEMMNNGLINVLNIPITNNKEIMNVRDSKRRFCLLYTSRCV